MDLTPSSVGAEMADRMRTFLAEEVLPRNAEFTRHQRTGTTPDWWNDLRSDARSRGLWNMAMPNLGDDDPGTRLTNLDYAPVCELIGRVPWAPPLFNTQPPDVPNMTSLLAYATPAQREQFLEPMLDGRQRSAFAMTEPAVASSDATNIATTIERDGNQYVINGHKWYISGAHFPDCAHHQVMGVTNPEAPAHQRHSLVLVPADTPGITLERTNTVLGYDGAQSEITYHDVRVPADNVLGSEGGGFVATQVRLGPARLHHAMRLIGACEAMIELMRNRAGSRTAFGRSIEEYDSVTDSIARSRIEVNQARLLLLSLAYQLDTEGGRAARVTMSMAKVAVSEMAWEVVNRAVQLFGAKGLSDDTPIAQWMSYARTFLIADGPTAVHLRQVARYEPDPDLSVAVLDQTYQTGTGR